MDVLDSPSEPPPEKAALEAGPAPARRVVIKGHCQDCAYYRACPRMRGENVCYGKKVTFEEHAFEEHAFEEHAVSNHPPPVPAKEINA